MPREPRLTLLGKHPAFGDFIAVDVPEALRDVVQGWSDATFAAARLDMGEQWEAVYDAVPPLRFWMGEALTGLDCPFAGVMAFSRDRVGRRSPLLLGWLVEGFAPPFKCDTLHEAAEAALTAMPPEAAQARDLLPGLPLPEARALGPRSFWAATPGGGLPDIAAVDHRAAAARRSYWWTATAGDRAGLMVAADGLPDHAALMLLMRGVSADALRDDDAV